VIGKIEEKVRSSNIKTRVSKFFCRKDAIGTHPLRPPCQGNKHSSLDSTQAEDQRHSDMYPV
jgi:hypothetical protein